MSGMTKAAVAGGLAGFASGLAGMVVAFVAVAVGQGEARRRKARRAAAKLTQANDHIADINSRLTVVPGGAS